MRAPTVIPHFWRGDLNLCIVLCVGFRNRVRLLFLGKAFCHRAAHSFFMRPGRSVGSRPLRHSECRTPIPELRGEITHRLSQGLYHRSTYIYRLALM